LDEKLRTQLAKTEQTLRDQFAREQQQAAAKAVAEIARAKADTAAQVEKARKEATKAAAAALQSKIAEAVAQAMQVERTKAYGEKLALEQQLEEMKRRLQRRSAHDIGEPAEGLTFTPSSQQPSPRTGFRASRRESEAPM
jgi:hypothetical protein